MRPAFSDQHSPSVTAFNSLHAVSQRAWGLGLREVCNGLAIFAPAPVWPSPSVHGVGTSASTTTYQYQGNVVTVTDPAGKQKTYTVDAFSELIQVTEASPNPATEPTHQTYYTYDLLGHLTQVSMPRTVSGTVVTQTRTWVYSSTTQLLTSKTPPESGATSYTYNTDTTLATVVDANNHEKKFTYDTYGRVTQISRGTLSGSTFTEDTKQRSNYTYDSSHTTNCGSLTNTIALRREVPLLDGRGVVVSTSYHSSPSLRFPRFPLFETQFILIVSPSRVSHLWGELQTP